MTRQVKLKDALALEWPPKNAATADEAPIVDLADFITDAHLTSDGYLVLKLKRDALKFTSSVPVPMEFRDSIETAICKIVSKTVSEAGGVTLCVP